MANPKAETAPRRLRSIVRANKACEGSIGWAATRSGNASIWANDSIGWSALSISGRLQLAADCRLLVRVAIEDRFVAVRELHAGLGPLERISDRADGLQ